MFCIKSKIKSSAISILEDKEIISNKYRVSASKAKQRINSLYRQLTKKNNVNKYKPIDHRDIVRKTINENIINGKTKLFLNEKIAIPAEKIPRYEGSGAKKLAPRLYSNNTSLLGASAIKLVSKLFNTKKSMQPRTKK